MEGIKLLDGDARVVQSLEPWSPPIEPIGVEQYIMEGIVAPVVVIDLLDPLRWMRMSRWSWSSPGRIAATLFQMLVFQFEKSRQTPHSPGVE